MNSSISSSNPAESPRSSRRFLAALAATPPALFVALAALAYLNYARLPAPWISESMAFNEKARWLDRRMARDAAPDVLVIGSSMALNNISGPAIQSGLGVRSVINTGSWGLSVESTGLMFAEILRHLRPRLVVLAVYHGDFRTGAPMEIEWPDFARSLGEGRQASLYLHNPDLWYYIKSYLDQREDRALGRATYSSLDFDGTGGVPLDCAHFHRTEARWNHFRSESFKLTDFSAASLAAAEAMARTARQRQIPFWVVVCPLRPEAERTFAPEIRAALWQRVRERVEFAGGLFIASPEGLGLSDDDFADYCHLNGCGANKFTAAWVREGSPRNTATLPR